MKFQVGGYYQHSGSTRVIHIIGHVETFFHGSSLLSEDSDGSLMPVGQDEGSAQNWHRVSGWPRDVYGANGIPEPTTQTLHVGADNPMEVPGK